MKKLTDKQWDEIRILLNDKIISVTEIARMYNVHRNSIHAYFKRHDKKIKKENIFREIIKRWKI